MNEAEKERLIKKDIVSIENRVRHAFNQGYEMGVKELKAYREQSGDAISRQAVLKIIDGWYDNNRDTENIEDLIILITYMSSVTPQQRTGQWIEHFDESGKWYECDKCHTDWGGSVNYCPNCGAKM